MDLDYYYLNDRLLYSVIILTVLLSESELFVLIFFGCPATSDLLRLEVLRW